MTKTRASEVAVRVKPRSPSGVAVSAATEFTDSHGIHLLFGVRRSLLYHLDLQGLITSVSLKENGEKRGKRLYYVPSVRAYLNSKLQDK